MSDFTGANGAAFTSLRDDWETPGWLFDSIDSIWHFDLDPASNGHNQKCARHFTAKDDGLKQDWGGYRVFLNPPYGRVIGDWMRKAVEESKKPGTVVVCLVPARTDTRWWWDNVVPHAAEVAFIKGRLRFCIDGEEQSAAPFPSALVRFGGALPNKNRDE